MTALEESRTDATDSGRRTAPPVAFIVGLSLFWGAVGTAGVMSWIAWRSSDSTTVGDAPSELPPSVPFREYPLPEFSLTECRGRRITHADLRGRPAVVCFIFTRCTGQCRRVDDQMRRMQDLIASTDTRLVTITVDPAHDTAEVLQRHAESLAADPERWWFLTGKEQDVYKLIHDGFQLSVAQNTGEQRTEGNEVSHSDAVLYVDSKGTIVGKYSGSSAAEMSELRRRIERDYRKSQSLRNKETRRGG